MSTHQQSKPRRANQSMTDESGRPSTCRSKVGCAAMDEPCTNKILPAALVGSPAKDDRRAALGCRFRRLPLVGPNVRHTSLPCAFLCPALRVAAVGLQRESA